MSLTQIQKSCVMLLTVGQRFQICIPGTMRTVASQALLYGLRGYQLHYLSILDLRCYAHICKLYMCVRHITHWWSYCSSASSLDQVPVKQVEVEVYYKVKGVSNYQVSSS